MSHQPNTTSLSKAAVAGVVLAVVGIILFVTLWVVLGQQGMAAMTRLLLALCLPPVVIGGLIAVYVLVIKGRKSG